MKKVFYIEAVTSVQQETAYEKEDEKYLFPRLSYSYYDLNLDELVELAKTEKEAKDEYLVRIHSMLLDYAKKALQRNSFLDVEEVYHRLQKAALKALDIYDKSRGPFLNLLRKILFISENDIAQKEIIRYVRELKYFGTKVQFLYEGSSFCDSAYQEDKDKVIHKVDLENFIQSLKPDNKRIFIYYLRGYSVKDIALAMNMNYSTVAYHIRVMLEKFRQMETPQKR